MKNIDIVILAAGAGTRMQSERPKVLLETNGKPLINHLLDTLTSLSFSRPPVIVVGYKADEVKGALGTRYTYVHQNERKGTAHAVAQAKDILRGRSETVITFFGDTPFISADSIRTLIESQQHDDVAFSMGVSIVPHFEDHYKGLHDFGRIIRDTDGSILQNIEKKNFTPEIASLKEVNPGFYCFNADWLWDNIDSITPTLPANEYYLPSLIDIAHAQNMKIRGVVVSPEECLGANTREHLVEIESLLSTKQRAKVSV